MRKVLDKLNKGQLLTISLLADIYTEKHGEEMDYDTVDVYYAYLGYDLYADELLKELGIQGTSDLQEAMLYAQDFL